ncbi:HD domain-containing protein [Flavobacterium salilacus subsp. salilacus]|uniref:Pycsar system effector family protein n=1 Tax=Flavobacterium TaxID=237 RepID=UPI001074A858|nr:MULTISPECIES: Pycsar system effector family protein [Flavobacterium]KAF2519660.1 HD domain-containing protein [Flavobacterium salilacus subsp. salilacus]MBE1614541.1 HD domain-containing protein [Flavobacterium sp. SaA2.13]
MITVKKAEDYVFNLFKDKLSADYIYHNFNHTLRVVNATIVLADKENVDEGDTEILLVAAWLHDAGYVEGDIDHEETSCAIAEQFLTEQGYPAEKTALVCSLIRVTKIGATPVTPLENIIKDADCSHFATKNYIDLAELLREEWRITHEKVFTDLEWAITNRNILMYKHRFYTDYAKRELQPIKENNIALLQATINDLQKPKKKKDSKEKINTKKLEQLSRPERGIDTMFRVTLNNHTRLSEIADSKANIMISVNAIIISVALTTLIPKLDSPNNKHLIIPTLILILFSVVSIIFAILSTRPKVTQGTFTREDINNRKVNLLFFGNFYKMPLSEYDWAVNEMMKDRKYLYDSMIKDLYYLGLVLNRKYKLLRITYNIFMIGIIISVGVFIYAFSRI